MDDETSCGEKHGFEPSLSSDEEQGCENAAILFRALGDANRLRILKLLARREMCVSEMTVVLRDNLPAISQRLKLLRAERLVRTRRQGSTSTIDWRITISPN